MGRGGKDVQAVGGGWKRKEEGSRWRETVSPRPEGSQVIAEVVGCETIMVAQAW